MAVVCIRARPTRYSKCDLRSPQAKDDRQTGQDARQDVVVIRASDRNSTSSVSRAESRSFLPRASLRKQDTLCARSNLGILEVLVGRNNNNKKKNCKKEYQSPQTKDDRHNHKSRTCTEMHSAPKNQVSTTHPTRTLPGRKAESIVSSPPSDCECTHHCNGCNHKVGRVRKSHSAPKNQVSTTHPTRTLPGRKAESIVSSPPSDCECTHHCNGCNRQKSDASRTLVPSTMRDHQTSKARALAPHAFALQFCAHPMH
jgi:hypothetical protein